MSYEEEFMQLFANNLKEQMVRLDITQLELAERLGVSQSIVSEWCLGRKQPRMSKVDKMCEIFGCVRSDLMLSNKEKEEHYVEVETARVAQALHDNPNLRILFDAIKDVPAEDITRVAAIINAFKSSAIGGDDNG